MMVAIMGSGPGIDATEIVKKISEELISRHKLHDINQDLQILDSEEINPTESTNGQPVAEQYVKDIKNCINLQMQGMKYNFDKKIKKETEYEQIKSGFESALEKETEDYTERIFALQKKSREDNQTFYLSIN